MSAYNVLMTVETSDMRVTPFADQAGFVPQMQFYGSLVWRTPTVFQPVRVRDSETNQSRELDIVYVVRTNEDVGRIVNTLKLSKWRVVAPERGRILKLYPVKPFMSVGYEFMSEFSFEEDEA